MRRAHKLYRTERPWSSGRSRMRMMRSVMRGMVRGVSGRLCCLLSTCLTERLTLVLEPFWEFLIDSLTTLTKKTSRENIPDLDLTWAHTQLARQVCTFLRRRESCPFVRGIQCSQLCRVGPSSLWFDTRWVSIHTGPVSRSSTRPVGGHRIHRVHRMRHRTGS